MKKYLVQDVMVPLAEYATVSEAATLYEAVLALEKAQEEFDHSRYRHRAILVLDDKQQVIGKISQIDIIRALEPRYFEMTNYDGLTRFGFSKKFIGSLMEQYSMWQDPLANLCQKAATLKVKQIMQIPTEGEYVAADALLEVAMHQLVLGHHQSLLVIEEKKIVGILRLTDVFATIFHIMKASCAIP
ncbi:MAG: CBS protein [uncultured bacterium]|nr:MAG: CBS protein [uncultured bacterium]HBB70326.1 hypothetical protein [Geobacter sulfurreducens]